jgi:hypothetical protein
MRRRRLLLGAGLLALLVVSVGTALVLLAPTNRISPEGAGCINQGMEMEEVVETLRQRPSIVTGGSFGHSAAWDGDNGTISVDFKRSPDGQLRVCRSARFTPHEPRPLHDRLRRLLPW